MKYFKYGYRSRGSFKSEVKCLYLKLFFINLIYFYGGRAHFGAATLKMGANKKIYFSIKRQNHKDDIVTKKAAKIISKKSAGMNLVFAGIHYDDISKEEIKQILKNVRLLSQKIVF